MVFHVRLSPDDPSKQCKIIAITRPCKFERAMQKPPTSIWPNRRFIDLVGIAHPIIHAPMIGPSQHLAVLVSEGGGLGSLAAAAMSPEQLRREVAAIRNRTANPFNVNFFCHSAPTPDPECEAAWRRQLAPYYRELGLDPALVAPPTNRAPFDAAMCALIEELRPPVVSFHFGLPEPALLDRVKAAGAVVLSSATSVAEARWLEQHGVDAIIAQGAEAGGHQAMFLSDDPAARIGGLALIPQIVDAVDVPVIAAGGIADGRGLVAALALGASAVQIGTAYLFCPEAGISAPHRAALTGSDNDRTQLTNLFTGRPARGLVNRLMREQGPISDAPPDFPLAAGALQPLRAKAEAQQSGDFSPLWSGQAAKLGREIGAADLTGLIAAEAMALLRGWSGLAD
jgi:nitronate monooxygenase